MADCAIVIFGATGDLAKRKLLPDLYRLIKKGYLKKFAIIGAAFTDTTIDQMLEDARPYIAHIDEDTWRIMKAHCYYQQLDFESPADFKKLATMLDAVEKKEKLSGNRLLYCATSAHFFCSITQHMAIAGVAQRHSEKDAIWHRIVYEKPFGFNAHSAQEINQCIARYFDESQIYRIDHYLTKEVVSNIALIRFTNCVFEPLWNNRYIDNVQIILSESLGIEGRGVYYDQYGALADVVQNHMLELVALIGMEAPEKLTGEYIRDERAKVLQKIQPISGMLGQYEGYQQESHVASDSQTETFASIVLRINNPRWAGVPFYLRTGKCLDKKETKIHIKFKQVDCLLANQCPSPSNYLTIEVAPEASFSLGLNAKKPGGLYNVVPINMDFCHHCVFGDTTPEAYEVLFEEVIRGDKSLSVRSDEIEYAWHAVDALRALNLPVYTYEKGSRGPQEMDSFAQKQGMIWRS